MLSFEWIRFRLNEDPLNLHFHLPKLKNIINNQSCLNIHGSIQLISEQLVLSQLILEQIISGTTGPNKTNPSYNWSYPINQGPVKFNLKI